MRYIALVVLGILLCNGANIYCRMKFDRWVSAHGMSRGMPITWDLGVAEFIAHPIEIFCQAH